MDRQHPTTPNSARERETALWLALLDGIKLQRRTAKEIIACWCVRDQRPLVDLSALSVSELAAALALPPEIAAQVARALGDATASVELRRLRDEGIALITRADAAFPEELALHLPEVELPYLLYYRGALDILAESGIAVGGCHALDALDDSDLAQLALALTATATPAIGGFERGADRELTLRTVAAGGQALAILPLGLSQAGAILSLARSALDTERLLLLSPFVPDTPYGERTAQARLPLVAALAHGLLLVEPDQPPEDWPGARDLLARGAPVVVVARQDSAAVQSWAAIGARVVDSPGAASEVLSGALSAAHHEAGAAADGLPGVEPIFFQDADEAIEVLSRSGNVPPALARRLRESSMFGYQDIPDVDLADTDLGDADVGDVDIDPESTEQQ